jgi:hypothetical protein
MDSEYGKRNSGRTVPPAATLSAAAVFVLRNSLRLINMGPPWVIFANIIPNSTPKFNPGFEETPIDTSLPPEIS